MAGYESQLQYQDPHAFGRSLYGVHSPTSVAPPHGSQLPPAAAAAAAAGFYGPAAAAAAAADFSGCWGNHPAAAAAAAAAYSAASLTSRGGGGGSSSGIVSGVGGSSSCYPGFHQGGGGYEPPVGRLVPGQGPLSTGQGSRHHNHHHHHHLTGSSYDTAAMTPTVNAGGGGSSSSKKKPPHVKKPLNAFMLFMKEMRAKVVAECTLKESAAINQILGRKWHALSREEQAKYYELARKEKELHMQLYPGWTARDNYAIQAATKKKVNKKRRPTSGELLLQQHQQHQQQQEMVVAKKAFAGQQAMTTAFDDGSGYQSYLMNQKPDYRVASDSRPQVQFDDYPGLQQSHEGVVTFTELT